MPTPPTPAFEAFGAAVRRRRKKLGLSQEELAAQVGIHPTYVSSVERGLRNVTLKNILRLGHALSLDPADLVREADRHWR